MEGERGSMTGCADWREEQGSEGGSMPEGLSQHPGSPTKPQVTKRHPPNYLRTPLPPNVASLLPSQ